MAAAIQSLQASLERVILDPRYHDLLAVVKGARNGAVYGTKVRFPHALVLREKLWLVFRATRTHARNLAKFVTIYKFTCFLLKHYGPTPGKEGEFSVGLDVLPPGVPVERPSLTNQPAGPYDTFVAGMLGGYLVFGGRSSRTGKISSVNQQIVVYVFARVVLALARLAVKPGYGLPVVSEPRNSAAISHYAWPVFAATSWGLVMHLFRYHAAELQPSLRSSMTYLYLQSNEWDGLRNFLWHNK
ncbi:hypothetical protein PpBr36_00131 [Pyricularia pennisetigena]|uniref:hypothetical protein n=1 Tax=Pyricularia pennisetigena TaxID=1578925 RepID=UPI001154F2F0|nr:hypothetical protein PpBr36_00131 [Pyricularia pennisetigena]TLS28124.1 hypothetical protein PpBr36_00131 [Pyricularia pennisetigena]